MKKTAMFACIMTAAALLAVSCAKKTVSRPDQPPAPPTPERMEEVYLREGFIEDDLFRVVIVDSAEGGQSIEDPRDKAEKRALATLQKYLLDKDRIYDNNTRAELINLIESDGSFSKMDITHNNNSVYYLDIRKRNIRRFVEGMAQHR